MSYRLATRVVVLLLFGFLFFSRSTNDSVGSIRTYGSAMQSGLDKPDSLNDRTAVSEQLLEETWQAVLIRKNSEVVASKFFWGRSWRLDILTNRPLSRFQFESARTFDNAHASKWVDIDMNWLATVEWCMVKMCIISSIRHDGICAVINVVDTGDEMQRKIHWRWGLIICIQVLMFLLLIWRDVGLDETLFDPTKRVRTGFSCPQ